MLRIAVVDDEWVIGEKIRENVQQYCEEKEIPARVDYFEKGPSLLYEIEEGRHYDAFLLDIEMPEMNGMELARRIRRYERISYVIFITSHMQYAMEGYEVNAYRYLLKDELLRKLPKALACLLEDMQMAATQYFVIENAIRYEKVRYRDILYIYRDKKYAVLVTPEEEYRVRSNLRDLYQSLDQEQFFFIERGYIVNIAHITALRDGCAVLSSSSRLPISQSHMNETKMRVMEYWRKRG